MSNLFNAQEKHLTGKVIVRTRPSYLVKGSTIQHVVRHTADDAAVATAMMEHTDIVKLCDMTVVMSAFVAGVRDLVAKGNAVRVSGLGTFYLTAKESEEGGSEFDMGFTPDKDLTEAAKMAEAHITMQSESAPAIEKVINMGNMEENGKVKADEFVILNGKRMRVAGSADGDGVMDSIIAGMGILTDGGGGILGGGGGTADGTNWGNSSILGGNSGTADGGWSGTKSTGIFMAPCDEYGNYKTDMSDWTRVEDRFVVRNFMTEVIFKVPNVQGDYRIVIATKAPLNGSTRADKLLKHERFGASAVVTVE